MTSEEIYKEQIYAMKAQDNTLLPMIKTIRGAVHNIEMTMHRNATEDDVNNAIKHVLRITREERKSRTAILGDNEARVIQLTTQIEWMENHLPPKLTDEEVEALTLKAIEATGATSMRDMRSVITYVKENTTGDVENSQISAVVKEQLNK